MRPALIIFIKNPKLGTAKTRIAKTTGDEKALRIYKELLKYTRQVSLEADVDRFLFYSSHIDENDQWSSADFNKRLQKDTPDLGDRMVAAFRQIFETNSPVLIIGSDCATLTKSHLAKAIEALKTNDFVIGPSTDGGYYLLGMSQFEPAVFNEIEWSTEQVLPTTLLKIKELEKKYRLLEPLTDIDTEADWEEFGWEISDD